MIVVGLTGGIGSGKTTVANRLRDLGAAVVDTDEISRGLTAAGGDAIDAVRREFGARFIGADGALDRAAMREIVFEDPAARGRLEAILHPSIRAASDRALAQARAPYALLVVPLLFESGAYRARAQRILVVDCAEEAQVGRAAARSGLAPEEIRRIMAAQWPRWRRLQCADDVIWNGGAEAALDAQVAALHQRYETLARNC